MTPATTNPGSQTAGKNAQRRSYGTGSLYVRADRAGHESWYGRWYASGVRIQRKLGRKRMPGTGEGLTRAQVERELRHRIDSERGYFWLGHKDAIETRPVSRLALLNSLSSNTLSKIVVHVSESNPVSPRLPPLRVVRELASPAAGPVSPRASNGPEGSFVTPGDRRIRDERNHQTRVSDVEPPDEPSTWLCRARDDG